MDALLDFFLQVHDPRFVVLAGIVCLVSSFACVNLLRHAGRARDRMRLVWIMVSALSVGFGIWATHFIAILAFRPGFPLSHDLALTALSLLIAVGLCGLGIGMAVRAQGPMDRFLGGGVIGIGIASMHYVGIAALLLGGEVLWNADLIGASILVGMLLSGFALAIGAAGGTSRLLVGAALLAGAICAMHFTAMAAADFSQCFALPHAASDIDPVLMLSAVFATSLIILAAALGSIVLDEMDRRRTQREEVRRQEDAERLESLRGRLELALQHMRQGLILFDANGRIVLHNERLRELLELSPMLMLEGRTLHDLCRGSVSGLGWEGERAEHEADKLTAAHEGIIASGGGSLVQPFGNDRAYLVQHSPVVEGGWVTTIEDISERRRNEAAIAHMAQHDALTGLPNRARFDAIFSAALEAANKGDDNLAVMVVDLDRFKEINDTYGHAAGDVVLRALADRMRATLKSGEVFARFGGDEFAALKTFTGMEALRDFLERLERALTIPVEFEGAVIQMGGSVGVAVFPEDGAERSKLLSNADLAMYRAKSDIDRRVCFYEHEMDEHARERRSMARDLWSAVDDNSLHLAFQVQKSVVTGDTTGFEVLLRWNRPGHGPVPPMDFIPVAEECGAILGIGAWVLHKACAEAAAWPKPHRIAVNISGRQLAQVELVDIVRSALVKSGLAPERLELEVTETSLIADRVRALHILRQIRAMGVSVAIDDFGTGYSSLDTLRSFPFDKIKLDRSFMVEVDRNEQSKAIIRAILALGRSLSVTVLAEGVETQEQLQLLQDEGCNEAQGFLLGRPGAMEWSEDIPARRQARG